MQIIFTGQHTFHKVLLQSTQDNSNLQGKLKTFRVIESSSSSGVENKMTGYKEKTMFNVILFMQCTFESIQLQNIEVE